MEAGVGRIVDDADPWVRIHIGRGEIAVRGWRQEGRNCGEGLATGGENGEIEGEGLGQRNRGGGGVFAGEGGCGEGWGGTVDGRRWRWRRRWRG